MTKKDWIELEIGRIYNIERSIFEKVFKKNNQKYVLTLFNKNDKTQKMQILTGKTESQILAMAIENIEPPVQTMEILFKNVIREFELKLEYVLINELSEDGYYKSIAKYCGKEKCKEFQARTVDLITLCLRHSSPIYIEKEIFEKIRY
ncbi:bifunctional nuclease family protein [Flavobacterium sp. HXWNR69]|uniref:Bifunctional nuclease family protein n=1 Tax=Flavobacterium fragile TaxID=2949085 RepID=A0ABT0TGN8_9FLAO|nr:bifunctional nuclease domain-containing protein [Flavobacterium sp. HXWNR69]MCL9770149.1 bifunctional nuclease family protein [Flavobacterium sp. HXWNR69]